MSDTNPVTLLDQLNEVASNGDWQRLDTLSSLLSSLSPPADEAAMARYLFSMQTAIISARTVRADIVKSLHRLSAAASFNQCG